MESVETLWRRPPGKTEVEAIDEPYGISLPGHPVLRIKRDPIGSRDRVLTHKEIQATWWAPAPPYAVDIARLQLLTMQRGKEIRMMRRDQIDGHWWSMPPVVQAADGTRIRMVKNKRGHRVWLSQPALEIVQRRMAAVEGQWLFPSSGRLGFLDRKDAAIKAARAITKTDGFNLHDLRRTGATLTAEALGISDALIKKILNHTDSSVGVTAVYNRYQYDKEKQEILDGWAKVLVDIVGTERPDNIPLYVKGVPRRTVPEGARIASAARVSRLRRAMGIDYETLGMLLGAKHKDQARHWLNGTRVPSAEVMQRIEQLEKKYAKQLQALAS